ncbi:hypothetical protein PENTCL1PPCAC_12838 [Pristionchus entomophagus]|uniref:Uncharacterized protein n=1 Tax=Pristionchus entomophagus TaxID=358040 RepID=A0AAV5T5X1_9BILA|nr:hypothetical protein PENTCL1PPCAC_12838 [Pristionchus entomophagus]
MTGAVFNISPTNGGFPIIKMWAVKQAIMEMEVGGVIWGVGECEWGVYSLFIDVVIVNNAITCMALQRKIEERIEHLVDSANHLLERQPRVPIPMLSKITVEFKRLTSDVEYKDLARRAITMELNGVIWSSYAVKTTGSGFWRKEFLEVTAYYDEDETSVMNITSALSSPDQCSLSYQLSNVPLEFALAQELTHR